MPFSLDIKAHAKVNLFLNLLGPRPDSFHEVRFVMQGLELADVLTLTVMGEGLMFHLTCSDPELATADNLVFKAYHLFYEDSGLNPMAIQVHLEKHIPVAAGLGGGSSDAAVMLAALNVLHQSPLNGEALHFLASQLGSDVPFFLEGGTCVATGRGQVITPRPALPSLDLVLVKPRTYGISTAKAYHLVWEAKKYQELDFTPWETLLQTQAISPHALAPLLHNDFEAVLFPYYPDLARAKELMLEAGLSGALLSLFGLLDQPETQWPRLQHHFPKIDWQLIRTRFITPEPAENPTS
jgi:4-diphosphocytidyl-2-C-methyl-D-erythritol kinase